MPKPLLLVAARSKLVRRLATAVAALVLFTIFAVLTPLVAVPAMLAGDAIGLAGRPMVVGEWGYPLAGDYFKGRGFGWHPVEGLSEILCLSVGVTSAAVGRGGRKITHGERASAFSAGESCDG